MVQTALLAPKRISAADLHQRNLLCREMYRVATRNRVMQPKMDLLHDAWLDKSVNMRNNSQKIFAEYVWGHLVLEVLCCDQKRLVPECKERKERFDDPRN